MVRMQTGAARLVFDLIRDYKMDCEAKQTGIINAAHTPSAMDICLSKCDEYSPYVEGCRMLSKDEVTSMTGSEKYFGGWLTGEGGHLNPLGYARELARAVLAEGGEIFTGSPVQRVVPRDGKWGGGKPAAARCWPNGSLSAPTLIRKTSGKISTPRFTVSSPTTSPPNL